MSCHAADKSAGYKENFETEDRKCIKNNEEIIFNKKMICNYYFGKRQDIIINILRKIPFESNYKRKLCERLTALSSLVCSHNSIYERKISENDENSEIICIKLEKLNSFDNKITIFDYFKSGLKLSCLI